MTEFFRATANEEGSRIVIHANRQSTALIIGLLKRLNIDDCTYLKVQPDWYKVVDLNR